MVYILCFFIGLASSLIGAIAGLGGGILFVPAILFFTQFMDGFSWATPQTIVGMSLLVMVFTGLSSTIAYIKYKRVDIKSGLIFLTGSIPGSLVGVWINRFIEGENFKFLFGFLMLFISIMFFIKKRLPENPESKLNRGFTRTFKHKESVYQYSYSIPITWFIAFIVGICSGLFGIGGGSLMVPAMILLFGFPATIAAPTSMFMIFISSSVSSIAHITLGHIVWEYVIFFIPGAWIGGQLGARISQKLKNETIEWILRILIVIVGIRLIWEGLS
jgi:uncharacterized protein